MIRRITTCLFILCAAGLMVQAQDPFRIAMIGCHRQFEPAPALVRYLEAEPDLCLWIGDNVYADTEDDFSFIETCYDALAAKPAFQELQSIPTIATWDDHDYGLNNAGKEYPLKEESKAYFRQFWQLEEQIPEDRDGIYYSHYIEHQGKTVQFIMLDVRYNRDEPFSGGDVLGENQWAWLEEELMKPADLRLVASGFQVLLGPETGSESWSTFPEARRRLFAAIRYTGAQHLVFLTGDQHYGEVCRMKGVLDFDAIELQFAGINQIEDPEYNPWRVAPAITSLHSYALIDVHLEETKTEVPHLEFSIFNAMTNERELRYRVNLSELETNLEWEGATRFTGMTKLRVKHNFPELRLGYTTDGTDPKVANAAFAKDIPLAESTTVRAALFGPEGSRRSPVSERRVTQLVPVESVPPNATLRPGLAYRYYEKAIQSLEELTGLSPKKEGFLPEGEYLQVAERADSFAFVFSGYLEIPKTGVYYLELRSDDGARLYLDDELLVDNDGSHSARRREGVQALQAGLHPIRLEYFDDYSGETLQVTLIDQAGNKTSLKPGDFWGNPDIK